MVMFKWSLCTWFETERVDRLRMNLCWEEEDQELCADNSFSVLNKRLVTTGSELAVIPPRPVVRKSCLAVLNYNF